MPTQGASPKVLQFGVFELDLQRRELRKQGVRVRLQEQPLRVLQLLLENPGEVVSREQLRAHIWPANTFVEFDQGLYSAMARLRDALGDSPDSPQFIQTVSRRGYRFIATVQGAGPEQRADPTQSGPGNIVQRRRFAFGLVAGLAAAAALLAILVLLERVTSGGSFAGRRSQPGVSASPQKLMVAVLPFENFSGDPQQEYFSDGLTEEVLTQLGQLNPLRLGVVARTTAMQYKHTKKTSAEIGRELGVQYIMEGSARREANRVRISAQLINVQDQTHLWSQNYDREGSNVIALQDDVARDVSRVIQVALVAPAMEHTPISGPVDFEAHVLYLQGRYHLNRGDEDEILKGIDYFHRAAERAPNYAQAYAGIAVSYVALTDYYLSPSETMPEGRAAALKAIQLDDSLADAHMALGVIRFLYDWDFKSSGQELQRAIELDPSNADAHSWYAYFLGALGEKEKADAEIRLAEKSDPLSLSVHLNAGWVYYEIGMNDRAVEELQKALELEPNLAAGHGDLWCAYVAEGKFARKMLESDLGKQSKDTPLTIATRAAVEAATGKKAVARNLLARLEGIARRHYVCPYEVASAYASLRENDTAFLYLEKSYKEHSICLIDLKHDPRFVSLRSDTRFADLVRRVGIPQSPSLSK